MNSEQIARMQSIRDAAQTIAARTSNGADRDTLQAALSETLPQLVREGGLMEIGVTRQGNHTPNSRYLYYDGQLIITLDEFYKGTSAPVHDHGVWEGMIIYSGAFHHKAYRRLDDGSVEGYADLELVEDRIMKQGDITVLPPDAQIHGFTALEEGSFFLSVVGGHYAKERHYFDPEAKTCVRRLPRKAE